MPKTKKQILFWFSFIFFLPGLAMAESYEIQLSGNRQPLPVQFFVENKTENLSALDGVSLDYHDRNFQLKTSNEIPDTAQFVWARANEPQNITLSTTSPLKIPVNRTLSNAGQNLRYTIIHPSLFQGKSIKSLQEVNFANKAVKVCLGHFQGNQLSITRPCQAPSSDLVIDESQTDVVIPVFPESVGAEFSVTFGDAPRGVRRVSASVADESSSCESPMSAEEISAAEQYVPLHGDFGKFGRTYSRNHKGYIEKFKFFVPPGAFEVYIDVFVVNDADWMHTMSRFGTPPTGQKYSTVSWGGGSRLDELLTEDKWTTNIDGNIKVVKYLRYYLDGNPRPLTEDEAGWVYTEIKGGSNVYWIQLQMAVDIPKYEDWYSTLSSWDEVENAHGMWSCREENTQTLRQLRSGQNPSEIDTGTAGTNSSTTPTTSTPTPSSSTTTPSTSTGTCQGETPYSDTPFSGGEVLLTGPEGSGHWQYKTNPGPNETCWWHCGKDGVRVSGKNACKPHENENQGRTCETPDGTYPEGPRTVSYYFEENKVTYYAACDYGPQSTKGWTLRSVTCPAGYHRVGSGWETKCEQ